MLIEATTDPDVLRSRGIDPDNPTSALIHAPHGRALMLARMARGGFDGPVPVGVDWEYWRQFDRVQVCDAVLISLGVDPRPNGRGIADFPTVVASMRALGIDADRLATLDERNAIAQSHAASALEGNGATVSLRRFVEWAAERWELPASIDRPGLNPAATQTDLQRAELIAQEHFSRTSAGSDWPTDDEGSQWLLTNQRTRGLVKSKKEALAILKMIRPNNLPKGPRRSNDGDEPA
jgi:hypothetical protein